MTPKRGDRIIIKNIPEDYPYRHLYFTEGRPEGVVDVLDIDLNECNNEFVGFFTGYTPYKDDCFSISGSGNSAPLKKVKFVKNDFANFWRFKDGIRRAHNGETYQEKVNYFEIDFNDIN